MKVIMQKLWSAKTALATLTFVLSLGTVHSVTAVSLYQQPLFMTQPVRPVMMLNMSNDHQLYYKAYDDYSDVDGDGHADTTYKNSIDYYGYFNSDLCYSYTSGVFRPAGAASDHRCSGSNWSGNFLNWATMTRMDTVRKILYGGKRWVDTADRTVLERTFLPQDAHSFAKYYKDANLSDFVDSEVADGGEITICNTTEPGNRNQQSQNITAPPLMRVAKGNYTLWASNERWQCRWDGNVSGNQGRNFNDPTYSGIDASGNSPSQGKEYHVRVEVCGGNYYAEDNLENCRQYGNENYKPTGVLHKYGETDQIYFGLMTGSYGRNKSGGVLRKNASSFTDEVNLATGQFATPESGGPGIVATLDAMRIVRYDFREGHYNNSDNCPWGQANFNDGSCTNWGNPQAEIYLESLRYLAGQSPSGVFNTDDSNYLSVLEQVKWEDPINEDNYCAPLNVLQFNASTTSFDGDQLGDSSDIGLADVNTATNQVGSLEGISGQYFVGSTGAGSDNLCTAKTVTSLGSVRGTCPDAPRLEGSYHIAGLAYHARVNGIHDGREKVRTFGVALAPAVPRVEVPVPGSNQAITILPACRNSTQTPNANCAIVDFKLIPDESAPADVNRGSAYINWEDTEQGGDYDQDMWGMLHYEVYSDKVNITTQLIAQSTSQAMGFGYVLSGTDSDGFHVHSGTFKFTHTFDEDYYADGKVSCGNGVECECKQDGEQGQCTNLDVVPVTQEYGIGSSTARLLEQPLLYAARWGGFGKNDDGSDRTEPSAAERDNPPYYYAVNPAELVTAVETLFEGMAGTGAAGSVATNSTRSSTDTFVYQAVFKADDWSGDVKAFTINNGVLSGNSAWEAAAKIAAPGNRQIYTSNGSEIRPFQWSSLTPDQQNLLNADDDLGPQRVDWLRGASVAGLRERKNGVMGNIVNSDPVYFGARDSGFSRLTASHGGGSYAGYASSKEHEILYVQANDGKLHALDANNGNEIFAYVPNGIYHKLTKVTAPNYGKSHNPHHYILDGQITVSDVYMGGWKTILVAGFGAGAEGAYALDVTNPMAPKLIHEFAGADIGNVMGKPAVVPLPSGKWAIVFGNGYKEGGGNRAKLIVAELGSNSVDNLYVMDTGAGGDNGLAEPEFTINSDWTVGYAYAGDLLGNMWKFDLSKLDDNGVSKLFQAEGQAITAAPTLGINPFKRDEETGVEATMVYFGTGRYMSIGDILNLEDAATQSFYGIADTGDGKTLGRDDLHENAIHQAAGRTVEEAQRKGTLEWGSSEIYGWYVDFPEDGERVVDKAILAFDTLFFPTLIPTHNACDFGGRSWIMQLTGVGLYPVDPDDQLESIEEDTLVTIGDLLMPDIPDEEEEGNPDDNEGSEDECEEGMIVVQKSDGTLTTINPCIPTGARGRQSWRQLR